MEDDTSESSEELTSESEFSDSYVTTEELAEDFELTWESDSDDSRPAGPIPAYSPWGGPGPEIRNRPIRRRRVFILPDSLSENSSQQVFPPNPLLLGYPTIPLPYNPYWYGRSPDLVRSTLNQHDQESDSDETYMSEEPHSPRLSPELMAPPGPNSPESPASQGNRNVSQSSDYSPSDTPIVPDPESSPQYVPRSRVDEAGAAGIRERRRNPDQDVPVMLDVPVIITSSPAARSPSPQLLDQPLQILAAVAVSKPVEEVGKLDFSVSSEGDDSSLCTICMCPLTNSGAHRVVCLRCGHIFGQSCVERWIKVGCHGGVRRCPTCNKKASLKDVRVLYLPKVVPLDTSERDRLLQEKEELAAQMKTLESDFTRRCLHHKLEVEKYKEKIAALEKQLQGKGTSDSAVVSLSQMAGLVVVTNATISPDGGCRVMAFNSFRQELVVSQPSGNTVFAGFGVRVVNSVDWQPSRFVLLHTKAIRDLQFHSEDRDLLLSVSLDQNAKLFDLSANTTVHTFKGEAPLWSCCWDMYNPHLLLLGSQSGKVLQYDRRMTDHYINNWETANNKTPVVALASAPCRARTPFPQGGFLSCRLNAIFSYVRQGEKYGVQELGLEGPFMSMRYDGTTQMMLTTSRPSSRSPHTRVCLSLLDSDTNGQVCAPLIHTFNSGSSARVMSRSILLPHVDDSVVVAHNESGRTLDMWSSKRGDYLHSIPVREPVIDMVPLPICNNKPPLLATLSEKKLTLYRVD